MRHKTLLLAAGAAFVAAVALSALPSLTGETAMQTTGTANPALHFLDRPDGRIAYEERGAGPLVILVPGLGDVRGEYRFLAPRLVAAGYRAVSMDLRGHGDSTTGWPDYSSAAIGGDIVALVKALNAGPATIIGTSMGAGGAAWAAAESPANVGGLVVIGPFVREISADSRVKGIAMKAMIGAAFGGPWAPGVWGMYYASLYRTAKPSDFDAYKAALVANLKEPGRMDATRAMLAAPKSDVEARLAEVRAPTLVVMGTKDPDFADPAVEANTVARLLRGTVAMVEGAGHYPHAEMPESVAPAILRFLAGSAGGAYGS